MQGLLFTLALFACHISPGDWAVFPSFQTDCCSVFVTFLQAIKSGPSLQLQTSSGFQLSVSVPSGH